MQSHVFNKHSKYYTTDNKSSLNPDVRAWKEQ